MCLHCGFKSNRKQSIPFRFWIQTPTRPDQTGQFLFRIHASESKRLNDLVQLLSRFVKISSIVNVAFKSC